MERLSDPAYARGLITFLFSLGTIIIAIVLTLYAVSRGPGAKAESFTHAKEILTILVGILGTIIGFYFGSESGEDTTATAVQPVQLNAQLSEAEIAEGGQSTILAFASGGSPPYRYSVASSPELADVPADFSSEDFFTAVLAVGSVTESTEFEITITARDETGRSIEKQLDLLVTDVPAAPEERPVPEEN